MGPVRITSHRIAFAAVVAAAVVLAGCAPRPPAQSEPIVDEHDGGGRQWTCRPLDPVEAERISGVSESWTAEGGSMLSAHRTGQREDGSPGHPTREGAVADALASAANAALDLLEQRGVSFAADKRRKMVGEVVDSATRGADIAFPRVSVTALNWDECLAVADDATAHTDTSWSAAVLMEYPIGFLRGDVNNVAWERDRAANEVDVLTMSADEHLAAGRWLDGLLDLARVSRVVEGTGVPSLESHGPLQAETAQLDRPTIGSARLSGGHALPPRVPGHSTRARSAVSTCWNRTPPRTWLFNSIARSNGAVGSSPPPGCRCASTCPGLPPY